MGARCQVGLFASQSNLPHRQPALIPAASGASKLQPAKTMNFTRSVARATVLALASFAALPVFAATPADAHAAHHPAAAASQPSAEVGRFNDQMATMQAMHEKMMAARTPDDRSVLMKDHMKAMQDGMAMMGQMPGGMSGMGGMGGTGAGRMPMDGARRPMTKGGTPAEHDAMHRRMDMMEMMMQMMVDQQAAMPMGPTISSPTK
jgi:hypothetical protein